MGQVPQAWRSLALWAPEGLVTHGGGHSEALQKKPNQQNQQAVAVLSGWEGNSSAGHWKEEFGSHSLCLEPTEGLQVGLQNMDPWWAIPAHSHPPSIFHVLGKCPWRYSPLSCYAMKSPLLDMSLQRNEPMLANTTDPKQEASAHCFQGTDRLQKLSVKERYLSKTAQLQSSAPLDSKLCLPCSTFPLESVCLAARWSHHQGWQWHHITV